MRKWLFPLACLATAALAAFLVWAWSTDYFLRRDCARHDGLWNAAERICALGTQDRPMVVTAALTPPSRAR